MRKKKMKDSELEALTLELGIESGLFLREPVTKLTDTLAPYPGYYRNRKKKRDDHESS